MKDPPALVFVQDSQGVTSIEYALLASLVAMVVLMGMMTLGSSLWTLWDWVANCVTNLACT